MNHRTRTALRSVAALSLASAFAFAAAQSSSSMTVNMSSMTITQIVASSPQFSTLLAAVKQAGLVSVLNGPGPFTVFAPTNAAFARVPAATLANLMNTKSALSKVLEYHVVSGRLTIADLLLLNKVKTLEGASITGHAHGTTLKVDQALVPGQEIRAKNGQIIVVDSVLLPPSMRKPSAPSVMPTQNLVQLLSLQPQFSTLLAAVKQAGLVSVLNGPGPFTVFAPTNAAFAQVPPALLKEILASKTLLTKVLEYHVVKGELQTPELAKRFGLTSLEGSLLLLSVSHGHLAVDGATVTEPNLLATNGVVQEINQVLLPSNL